MRTALQLITRHNKLLLEVHVKAYIHLATCCQQLVAGNILPCVCYRVAQLLTSGNVLLEIESISTSDNLLLKLQRFPRRFHGTHGNLIKVVWRCKWVLQQLFAYCMLKYVACNMLPWKLPSVWGPLDKRYCIAGNFRMVLIFAYFACAFCLWKYYGCSDVVFSLNPLM